MWRIVLVMAGVVTGGAGAIEEGFVSLADSPELAQWRTMGAGTWDWQDGAIHCDGQGSGWLRSERVYIVGPMPSRERDVGRDPVSR